MQMSNKTFDPSDKNVGTCVRMRRLMLHVTQQHLANALGISFQQVQKYEKGTNRISASRLQQISDVLKVPVSFFFEGALSSSSGASGAPLPEYATAFFTTSDGLALAQAFVQIKKPKLRRCMTELVVDLGKRG